MRARLRPDNPRPCSMATNRISCGRARRATGMLPASSHSCATSRRYAVRVCAALAARCAANASNSAAFSPDGSVGPRGAVIGIEVLAGGQEARDRHTRELGEPQQIDGAHRGMEPMGVAARQRENAERLLGAQRQVNERLALPFAAEPLRRFELRFRAAMRRAQMIRIFADAFGGRRELRQIDGRRGLRPQAHRDLRHPEILSEAVGQYRQRRLEIGRGEQRECRAVQLLADLVVLGAVADQLAKPLLEVVCLVAQRQHLSLRDRDCVTAVRMRNEDLGNDVRVILEERGILFQVLRYCACFHPDPLAIRELLNKSLAGATGGLPGMMARSKAKSIAGAIGEPSDKASAPASPVPKGWPEMRRLLRRPPRLVVRTTTFVVRLAFIRISRQRTPRGTYSEVP